MAIDTGVDGGGGVWSELTVKNGQSGVLETATSELMVRDCTFNVPVPHPGSTLSIAEFGMRIAECEIRNSKFAIQRESLCAAVGPAPTRAVGVVAIFRIG